jgi:hypothetical protein
MTRVEAELRAKVIEQVLDAVENRAVERRIREAHAAGEEPAEAAKRAVGWMGSLRDDVWWDTCPAGIRVRTFPPGVEFVIPWREIAVRALGADAPAQLSLF